ncbi:MAG: arginase family protein [Microbacterium sp.]|jgi:arginase|uniref:arginase family protein n=1 Tax=Microbacterium sp. TaxID=51671 RepID=UPI00281A31CA|nr:arginase family protein [Microbacterium sp.]MDR2323417.1 arginase family protein [Microbacterium sp.]
MTDGNATETSTHLRLVWPQWQGAGSSSVRELMADFPFDEARRGYALGTRVLQAVLPAHDGPTAEVPVEMTDTGLETRDGIEAKDVVLRQLEAALEVIATHAPERITTLGGDCSVSMAPFSALARRYPDDLAIVWIDSHPDMDTGETGYDGYHAMVVSALTGHGDPDLLSRLPGTVPANRVALAGMHDWTNPAHATTANEWGLSVFGPAALRTDSRPLIEWLRGTGASRVAIHFDVDTIDADEVQLGLGYDRGGLTSEQARRVVADIHAEVDVVALTIAEYVPRQVLRLQRLLRGMPLLG